MRIVPREDWGAREPRFRNTIATPTPELWLHHLASEWHGAEGMRQTQDFHMDSRGWSDIAYSFVVDDWTQAVYEGRGAGVAGGHTEGHNQVSHAICVMGNFDARPPADATLHTVAALVRHGREQGWWLDLTGGHRDVNPTACPGALLYPHIPTIRQLADQPEDDLTPEQAQKLNDLHAWMSAEKTAPAVKAANGINTAADVVGTLQSSMKVVFDPDAIADAVVANLPANVDAAAVKEAVKQALIEGVGS